MIIYLADRLSELNRHSVGLQTYLKTIHKLTDKLKQTWSLLAGVRIVSARWVLTEEKLDETSARLEHYSWKFLILKQCIIRQQWNVSVCACIQSLNFGSDLILSYKFPLICCHFYRLHYYEVKTGIPLFEPAFARQTEMNAVKNMKA